MLVLQSEAHFKATFTHFYSRLDFFVGKKNITLVYFVEGESDLHNGGEYTVSKHEVLAKFFSCEHPKL